MNAIARRLARGALPLSLFALPAAAQDPAEESRILRERLAAAEQRIEKLEQEGATRERAAVEHDIEGYLHCAPVQPPAGPELSGYQDGFFIRDAAGDFLLRFNGQLQVRYVANEQEDSLGDPHAAGFEIPRAKLVASGYVLHPRWQYRIQGNYDGDGGGMVLEDAWVAWYSESGWSITAGQFKCPVLREEKVDSMFQLCVERSVVNDALSSGERLTGVAVGLAKDTWRGWLTFTDGDGFPNTPALAADTDYAVSFRGELLLAGGFAQFDTFTSFRGEPRGVMLGLGLATQRGESGTPAPETVVYMASADLSVELGGANFLLQATWADVDLGDIDGPRNPFGIVVHGGYFATARLEIFARYEYGDLDPLVPPDTIQILTLGGNWYFDEGQRVKLTGDLGYAFDAVPVTQKYTGYRRDSTFAEGQVVVRIQLQLRF